MQQREEWLPQGLPQRPVTSVVHRMPLRDMPYDLCQSEQAEQTEQVGQAEYAESAMHALSTGWTPQAGWTTSMTSIEVPGWNTWASKQVKLTSAEPIVAPTSSAVLAVAPNASTATSSTHSFSPERSATPEFDPTGQTCPPGGKPRVTTTLWEDERTLCFQVEAKSVCVARREDNDMINGTKLLNVAGMSRGKRDGILKGEKIRSVVKIGAMHLKGVWIPFERALEFANKERITDLLYPLFVKNIKSFLYHPTNYARTTAVMAAVQHFQMLQLSRRQYSGLTRSSEERSPTPPHSASVLSANGQCIQGPMTPISLNRTTSYVNSSTVTQSLPATPVATPLATPPGYYFNSAIQTSQDAQKGYISSYSEQASPFYHTNSHYLHRTYPASAVRPLWEHSMARKHSSFSTMSSDSSQSKQDELKQTCEEDIFMKRSFCQELVPQLNHSHHEKIVTQKSFPLSPVILGRLQKEGFTSGSTSLSTMPALVHHGSDDASTITSQSSYSHQSIDDSYVYHLSNVAAMPQVLNDMESIRTSNTCYPLMAKVNQWAQQDAFHSLQSSANDQTDEHSIYMKTWSHPPLQREASPHNNFYQIINTKPSNNRIFRSYSMDQPYVSLKNTENDKMDYYQKSDDVCLDTERTIIKNNKTNDFDNYDKGYIKQNIITPVGFDPVFSNAPNLKTRSTQLLSDVIKPPKRRKTIHGYTPMFQRHKIYNTSVDMNRNFGNLESSETHFVLNI